MSTTGIRSRIGQVGFFSQGADGHFDLVWVSYIEIIPNEKWTRGQKKI